MSGAPSTTILPDLRQQEAADPRRSVFVTANAGSGKTSTLVDRVARLLLSDVRAAEILCVTYTKAAAAEMQSRLYKRLGAWAVMDDEKLRASLHELDGRDPDRLSGDDLKRARRLFAQALDTPGGLKIQTLHAFCEKLLRRFPLEAGVTPGFQVLEDQAAVALSRMARDDLARHALAHPDGGIGQAYAHFAVALAFKDFEALLGKIETDRARLTDYIERWREGRARSPWRLADADPERSAEAIETDFMRFVDRAAWVSVAEQMATGGKDDGSCADRMHAADWTFEGLGSVFLTSGKARSRIATSKAPSFAREWLGDLQARYCAKLDEVRKARLAEDTNHVLTLAETHARFYEARKADKGALDFGDMVARTVDLLTKRSSAAWVLYKLDGGIEHVLIDEAQDTAPEQWDIVEALTEGFFSGIGSRRFGEGTVDRSVFVVGDAKQSIYSFQGARPEMLVEKRRDFENRVTGAGMGFAGVPLETSFRSTPEVLSFVDKVFFDADAASAPDRARALVGVQGDIAPHKPMRAGDQGCIDLWPLYRDDRTPEREAWDDPVDEEAPDSARKRMARDLAREIQRQVEDGVAVQDKDSRALRPARYGDFLILVRQRDATFEEIIRALKTAGVPVAGADRLKLSTHIAFSDLISLARFALYPDDDLSLAEVLRSPFCDVDEDSLFDLAGSKKERRRLWAELRDRSGERPEWTRARALLDFVLSSRGRDPFAFFSGLLNRVDDTGLSGRARILARLGREAEEAIDETLNQVLAAEDRGGLDLETALAMLEQAEVEVKRELEGPRGEVRVMTVHGAKGLEAPVVILPDTTARARGKGPGLMPVPAEDGEGWLMLLTTKETDPPAAKAAREARDQRAFEESLRLLYVALTRARDRVIVMGRGRGNSTDGFEDGSWWSILSETFERLGPEVRDIGEDRRRYGHDPVVLGRGAAAVAAPTTVIPDWARRAPAIDPSARYVSPSQAKGAKRAAAPSPLAVASTGEGAPLGRFRRGDLIHLLLERLPEMEPDARPDAAHRLLARERGLSDDQRSEMITAAFGVLDDPRFAPVFGPGSRAEVALVGSAPELAPGVVINGRIDRLVITPERILVVDYKTNRPAPDRIEDADPAYAAQMAVYVAVLRALYPDRPVEAALVWTDGPKLMPVPQWLMDDSLKEVRG
ncbi:double-strand break repair helicase AddA [Brevundimonas bacteroides]|uniref:double-strand break repair helicase AddA n=1 Tax=Brevundimonas bacteroides TaxID=74311 RepID=UPI000497123D|nr:double-strand break repair helicase AddA [Brevundimonas bacteroides]